VFADFTAEALAAVAADTAATLPRHRLPGVDRLEPRRRPVRLPLVRRRPAQDPAGPADHGDPPGAFVLYYGDEIGMPDVARAAELERDPMTAGGLGGQLSRDRARTPMHWDASASGGFTPRASPGFRWATGRQQRGRPAGRPGSLLVFTRDLIRLRKAGATPDLARYEQLTLDGGLWVYRSGPLLVAANMADTPAPLPPQAGEVLLRTGDGPRAGPGPWEGLIARSGQWSSRPHIIVGDAVTGC
jgi:glycosidase